MTTRSEREAFLAANPGLRERIAVDVEGWPLLTPEALRLWQAAKAAYVASCRVIPLEGEEHAQRGGKGGEEG
jgi:hypothetical protein